MKSLHRSRLPALPVEQSSSDLYAEPSPVIPARSRLQAAELWIAVLLPVEATSSPQSSSLLQALAAKALQFTPRVSLEPPDALLFEVRRSLHLFGGLEALCRDFRAQCRDLFGNDSDRALSLTIAPTPLAALALARTDGAASVTEVARLTGAVSALPLRSLRWPEETLARLASMGVRTIGEALRLPRAGFARRCGPELLVALDRLLGRRSDPRSVFRVRERFRTRRDLHYETAAQDRLLLVVHGMLQEMESFLRQRQCGVNVLELRLAHRDLPDTRCLLRLAMSQHLAQEFAQLLQEQLARLTLPAVVRSCRLRSGRLIEQAPDSGSLWKPGEHGGAATLQMPAFIERLRARLGPEAVYGLCLVPEHRPEAAWSVAEPVLKSVAPKAVVVSGHLAPWSRGQRPLWLMKAPRRLTQREGRPVHEGQCLELLGGPERLETGWWDGRDICRDYYIARGAQGVKLWVFREREATHGWFLHGMFG